MGADITSSGRPKLRGGSLLRSSGSSFALSIVGV